MTSQASHSNASANKAFGLEAINGWRGPGALAIAIAHFAVATDFEGVDHFQCIAVLVDLFFVLSGVIIAQSYGMKLTNVRNMPEYVVRRFGRIWPVHAATLLLLVAYECGKLGIVVFTGKSFSSPPFASDGIDLPSGIVTNLLLLHSLGLHDRETWNFPSWSLSVEFFVYVVFALFCLIAPWPRRVLAVVTIALSLAILILVAPHGMRSTYDYGVFRCLAGFFAGTLVYEIATTWRIPRWPFPTLVEVLAIAAVGVWVVLSEDRLAVYLAPFVFCGLILIFAAERGAVSRGLKTWLFQKGAELSYAIYMVHAVVLIAFMIACHEIERQTHVPLFVQKFLPRWGEVHLLHVASGPVELLLLTAYTAVVMLAAIGTYHFVELPGRVVFNRVAKRLKTSRPLSRSPSRASPDAAGPGF